MGKPLYQRTWTSSTRESISNASWGQQFSIPKAGMEQLVQCICSDNQYGQAWKVLANLDSSATYVSFMACRDNSDFSATDVTLQYTKTTDSTSPVEYASPNDYSTSEKIVGTWVDGKPIYQKTITGTATLPAMPSYSSIGTTSELISSDIGDIIDVLITGKGTGAAYQGYQSPASYVAYVNVGGNINVGQGIASGTTEIAYRITVQYTKSTD